MRRERDRALFSLLFLRLFLGPGRPDRGLLGGGFLARHLLGDDGGGYFLGGSRFSFRRRGWWRRLDDQTLPGNVHHDRWLTGALASFVLERIEELDLRLPFHHQLALLVFRPQLKLGKVAAVLSRSIGDATLANHGVARPDHLDESHAVLSKLSTSGPVGDKLPEESHHQHSRRVHRGHADSAGVNLIDMNGVEVSGGAGVARQLNAIDRSLRQRRQLVAHVNCFEIEPAGRHQIPSRVARTTSVLRALKTRFPSSSLPSSSMIATSIFPAGPWRSRTSATRVDT